MWKSAHYEISSRKLKLKEALNSGLNTVCCFLESHGISTSTSINKVDTLSTSANIDEIARTRCFCICFGWFIGIVLFIVCTEYLKLLFFTVVMQLIRLFLVVNNNLIIDKLLQTTKKRLCFRVHCWHTSESCDSCGTAAQKHANDQSVFFFFVFFARCHEMYEPDCLTRALTQLTVLQVHWLWERDDNGHPRTLYTEGQGCDGLSTGTY